MAIIDADGWGDSQLLSLAISKLGLLGYRQDRKLLRERFRNADDRKVALAASIAAMRLLKRPILEITPQDQKGGALVFDSDHMTISTDVDKSEVVAKFHFRNPTDDPIRVLKAQASCRGCLEVKVEQGAVLHNGDVGTVSAIVTTKGLQGIVKKRVFLITDEQGKERRYALSLDIKIPEYFRFSSKKISWDLNSDISARTVRFEVLSPNPILITDVKSDSTSFVTRLQCVEPGRKYSILVTPNANSKGDVGYIWLISPTPIAKYLELKFWASIK